MLAQREGSVVVLVDVQPNFLKPIHEADRVLERCKFLLEVANLLEVPVITTEQYPARMGGTEESVLALLKESPIPKMSFSCAGSDAFTRALESYSPQQVFIIGIETHICVNQTAHHLLAKGLPVFVAGDAVSARTLDMHQVALSRVQAAGAVLCHTESVAYEWLYSAEDPKFRDALQIVKRYT